jgi:signal transduction histidine kinase
VTNDRGDLERYRHVAETVASVAHELKQPLGVVNTAASLISELLRRKALLGGGEDLAEALSDLAEANDLILRNVARARELVEQFRAVTVTQLTVRRERIDLPASVADVVAVYLVGAKPSRLDVEIQDRLGEHSGEWKGNPGYLSQILINLLSNAERYAYPGTQRGRVTLTLSAQDDGFGLEVRDYGAGIPASDLPRVFERLFTTGREQGGSGLGLAIVHELVTEALAGSIQVESTLGEGTAFALSLPNLELEGPAGTES